MGTEGFTFERPVGPGTSRMAHRRNTHSRPQSRSRRRARPREGSPVRIVVADSQAIDRGGLVGMLEDERDFEVVGEAATIEDAIRQCAALKPHVLVLSLNLPDQSRAAAIPAIRLSLAFSAVSNRSLDALSAPRDLKIAVSGPDCA